MTRYRPTVASAYPSPERIEENLGAITNGQKGLRNLEVALVAYESIRTQCAVH